MTTVGIDRLNIWGSTLAVDFRDVASIRGVDARSFANTRFNFRSLLPMWEDQVTLAVNAAHPLLDGIDPTTIGLLIVATESGLDFGKPVSTWVHRHLGLGPHCRNFEIKHACFGGTAALLTAAGFVREQPARKALVIMTDVARDHIGDPAELTAGSGAVALLVTANPRLLALDSATGSATREVWDVARPLPTGEHNDAVLSLYSYLDLIELAWSDFQKHARCGSPLSVFSHILYHTPLFSLAEKAHAALLESCIDDIDVDDIRSSLEKMVLPALCWNELTANIYSGSLYVSLAGLLATAHVVPGSRLGMFSYGSGACAEFFSGTVQTDARDRLLEMGIEQHLRGRRVVSVSEYESLVRNHQVALVSGDFIPDTSTPTGLFQQAYEGTGRLVLTAVDSHQRTYRRA
jgi:3-hydroxy-3-methylglutaryl CoA synthase